MYEKWCTVLDAVPDRDQRLEQELLKQQQNDELRVAFAEKANTVGAYIEAKQAALADLTMAAQGSMEARKILTRLGSPCLKWCVLCVGLCRNSLWL